MPLSVNEIQYYFADFPWRREESGPRTSSPQYIVNSSSHCQAPFSSVLAVDFAPYSFDDVPTTALYMYSIFLLCKWVHVEQSVCLYVLCLPACVCVSLFISILPCRFFTLWQQQQQAYHTRFLHVLHFMCVLADGWHDAAKASATLLYWMPRT